MDCSSQRGVPSTEHAQYHITDTMTVTILTCSSWINCWSKENYEMKVEAAVDPEAEFF